MVPMKHAGPLADAGLRFELLGPLRVYRNNHVVNLGRSQQPQVVLALLLLHGPRPFPRMQLISAIWGDSIPTYAVNLLQKYVSVIRQTLEPDRAAKESPLLRWTEAGYILNTPAIHVDLANYETLLRQARAARIRGDLRRTSNVYAEALQLWRGSFCEGLSSPVIDAERDHMEEQRIDVLESQVEVHLMLGDDSDQIFELRRLVSEYPLRERLRASLMLALYRTGHTAEALATYRATRKLIRDELGVEPSAATRRLHERMLAADPSLLVGREVSLDAGEPGGHSTAIEVLHEDPTGQDGMRQTVPEQLPPTISDFTGRSAGLDLLDTMLADHEAAQRAPLIIVVDGTAGVGKTALGLEWANRIKHRFSDGQLYVNLRGYDPIGIPMEPGEAVRGFLDALGIGLHRMPPSPEAQAALYRSLVAGRRILVVLDNARDAEQVRSLMPGGFTSVVIVTSRDDLAGLVVSNGAIPITLGLLSRKESREFLAKRLGNARVDHEAEAGQRIIEACARLPLALAIVAARAAARPHFQLGDLAGELQNFPVRLDVFESGNATIDIRRVFSWSYNSLEAGSARIFRLLGLQPGPQISLLAASALSGRSAAVTRKSLWTLARAHLVEEVAPGRFAMHDLLRAYAGELVDEHEPAAERAGAEFRLLDFFASTARAGDLLLNPTRSPALWLPKHADRDNAQAVVTSDDALRWFSIEQPVLLAAIHRALDAKLASIAYELVWALATFLDRGGHWQDLENTQRLGLEAARLMHDARAGAYAEVGVGRAKTWKFDFATAYQHYSAALRLFGDLGDKVGQAQCHRWLAWMLERQSDFVPALRESEAALALFRETGERSGLADALNAVGWFRAQLGDPHSALPLCEEALALERQIGHQEGRAHTLDSLGFVYLNLGVFDRSIACYEEAISDWRSISDRYFEAATQMRLGHAYKAAGSIEQARATWEKAWSELSRLGHPDAEKVRLELRRLDDTEAKDTSPLDHPVLS